MNRSQHLDFNLTKKARLNLGCYRISHIQLYFKSGFILTKLSLRSILSKNERSEL